MNFTRTKCWVITTSVVDRTTLRDEDSIPLAKKSILKGGYRAYCLKERREIEESEWFQNYLAGTKTYFYIDGSGIYRLVNLDLTENELYFEKDNLPVGFKPWVFYSWQSDYNPSRSHIKTAIEETILEINENRNPRVPLQLVESVRDSDGAADIVEAIRKNIDLSVLVIFDITNVAQVLANTKEGEAPVASKSYPNANVVFELGYALSRKLSTQIILIRRQRNDIGSNEVPFDFRQNRNVPYSSEGEAKRKIKETMLKALETVDYIPSSR